MSKEAFATPFSQQHQQKIEELVAIAKEQGYITYEEINDVLPISIDNAEQIDQVLIFLTGMDIQILNQAEVERQKERKKEAKELETVQKRSEASSDDPVRMYLKEMGSVPLLTREEEVEISKRIEKAQIQIEKIIMRFRYSSREAISIANYLIQGKDRFDKVVAEKEVLDKNHYLSLLPKLCNLLKHEDHILQNLLVQLRDPKLKFNEQFINWIDYLSIKNIYYKRNLVIEEISTDEAKKNEDITKSIPTKSKKKKGKSRK